MKIYLASSYLRRLELCGYRDRLQAIGHIVTSRWLNGAHVITDRPDGDDGSCSPEAALLRQVYGNEDLLDLNAASVVIGFTEPPNSRSARGGRHVEFGYALAKGKQLIVVGYRENIFHWLPAVRFFESFDDFLEAFDVRQDTSIA